MRGRGRRSRNEVQSYSPASARGLIHRSWALWKPTSKEMPRWIWRFRKQTAACRYWPPGVTGKGKSIALTTDLEGR